MKVLLTLIVPLPLMSAAAQAPERCQAPLVVPKTVTVPSSTYYNDGEPPKRFAHAPKVALKVTFGDEAIAELCGRPACGYVFEGCTDGDRMALPDPFKTTPETFARIVRHEIGHQNGWPATHGL